MKKFIFPLIIFVVLFAASIFAATPKVVVLIVLDQFPYSYIERFQPYFSDDGGFNFFIKHGANFVNARYEHALTKTAPGHSAIATGTYSHRNGIIANGWYDRTTKKWIGCVDDDSYKTVGNMHGGKSPNKLLTATLGDLIRTSSNYRSKVISVSFKDRVAILTAGKLGTAFWIEDSLIVTSTYYMNILPSYLTEFNKSGFIKRYFGKEWTEINPVVANKICDIDDAPYESDFGQIGKSFPHLIYGRSSSSITPSYYTALEHSPYGTEFLLNLAEKIFMSESLGTHNGTDMFTIGISTPDEVGHSFGPDSHETFDNVLQTDIMLGKFISFLKLKIGLENCLFVLTSDHGVTQIPELTKKLSPTLQAGRVNTREIRKFAEEVLDRKFGYDGKNNWIESIAEWDIYLNKELLLQKNIPADSAMNVLKTALVQLEPIALVATRGEMTSRNPLSPLASMIEKSFYPSRDGDVLYVLKPNYITSGDSVGTNHGEPYDCDTHVPLMFAGTEIIPGTFEQTASPVDIVPTVLSILKIECPFNLEGKVLHGAIK